MPLNQMILGNWKMNKTYTEITSFCKEFNHLLKHDKIFETSGLTVGVAPTYIGIMPTAANLTPQVRIMAQNANPHINGAFTSEVSYTMLKEINVNTVLVGHSEVRANLNESDMKINTKVNTLLNEGMTPILCVGESLQQFEDKKTNAVITEQLEKDLKDVNLARIEDLVIAYEPIWAIGTGKTATNDIVGEVCTKIRSILTRMLGKENAEKIHILYGGSVNEKNAKEILAIKNVDGVLVGGASLDPHKFYTIIQSSPNYKTN